MELVSVYMLAGSLENKMVVKMAILSVEMLAKMLGYNVALLMAN